MKNPLALEKAAEHNFNRSDNTGKVVKRSFLKEKKRKSQKQIISSQGAGSDLRIMIELIFYGK